MQRLMPKGSRRRIFALGLVLGFVLTSTLVMWIVPGFLSRETYVVGLSDNLGGAHVGLPAVALEAISTERVAAKLKIKSSEEALRLAQVFADRVASGFLPNDWEKRCPKEHHPILCISLDDYFKKVKESRSGSGRIPPRSRLIFSTANVPRLQTSDLGVLLSLVRDQKIGTLRTWTKAALATEGCPKNFNIALARMWEYYLDREESWEHITELDSQGMECLSADERHAEYVLMRAGLLQVLNNDFEKALSFFDRAIESDASREKYRVQYWRARSFESLGLQQQAAEVQREIIDRWPLSWFAITSYRALGLDPMDQIRANTSFKDQYFSDNDSLDRDIAWIYLMSRLDNVDFALQRFVELVVPSMDTTVGRGVFQHMARVFDSIGQHRLQIFTLNRLFSIFDRSVNVETLRLYFPKPYFEEIDASTPTMDTALLLGLVRQESAFDPRARSSANARGLLQVLPSTAQEIQRRTPAEQLYDSSVNIRIGTLYFERLLRYFDGSIERSLAGYNAGMGRVRQWEGRYRKAIDNTQLFVDLMPYRETREYVPSILRNAYWYHRLFPEITLALAEPSKIRTSDLLKEYLPLVEEKTNDAEEYSDFSD